MVLAVVTLLPKSLRKKAAPCHSVALKPLDGHKQKRAEAVIPGSVLESPNFAPEQAAGVRSAVKKVWGV